MGGLPCETCCIGETKGACQYKSVHLNGLSKQEQAQWWAKPDHRWNAFGQKFENGVAQTCGQAFPQCCPACAKCTAYAEADFRALVRPLGCDCDTNVDLIDPCFIPQGCGCYCQRLKQILDD